MHICCCDDIICHIQYLFFHSSSHTNLLSATGTDLYIISNESLGLLWQFLASLCVQVSVCMCIHVSIVTAYHKAEKFVVGFKLYHLTF